MAIGISIVLFSPILLLFVPQTVANSFHYTEKLWYVFTPGVNFAVYAIGFLLLFISSMLLFILDIKKFSMILSLILASSALVCFFVASQSYKSLSEDFISYSPLFSFNDYTYAWNEVDSVILIDYKREGYSEFKFVFTDGNSMKLRYNKYFRAVQTRFYDKLQEMNLNIRVVHKT